MNILVVCQYYKPEPLALSDICEELVKKGHSVTVVTGVPNYPMGKIYKGYRFFKKRDETVGGVKIHRCFTIGRRKGAFWRVLNYYSYAISSKLYIAKLKNDYDVVFVYQLSPVMMADAAIKYKKKHNKKVVLYCLDLWPESLSAGGIKSKGLIYNFFKNVSAKIYSDMDKILITSKSFSEYFSKMFGINDTVYLPQYADDIFSPEKCKKISNDTIDLLFAGNIGKAQSLDTVIKAAVLTNDIKNLNWHIVGDGSELENIKKLAKELDAQNVIFHGRKPLEEMPQYYSKADAMLVTLHSDPIISKTLPGKVQTYMAAGKPIIGAIDGETKLVIDEAQCGFCGESENAEQLAQNVRKFIEFKNKESFSENSRKYYETNFSKNTYIEILQENLNRAAKN